MVETSFLKSNFPGDIGHICMVISLLPEDPCGRVQNILEPVVACPSFFGLPLCHNNTPFNLKICRGVQALNRRLHSPVPDILGSLHHRNENYRLVDFVFFTPSKLSCQGKNNKFSHMVRVHNKQIISVYLDELVKSKTHLTG